MHVSKLTNNFLSETYHFTRCIIARFFYYREILRLLVFSRSQKVKKVVQDIENCYFFFDFWIEILFLGLDMANVDGLIDVESADVTVNSSFNLNFDWGTIGIIVGACVAVLIVIFVIVYFCGRGSATCCDNGTYQIHLECTQDLFKPWENAY